MSNLYRFSSRQANALSRMAFEKSKYVIVSSQWAKNHAVEDYGINPEKIHVVEFGANLDCGQIGKVCKNYKNKKHFNILLSGVNWVRKGGEIAVDCCKSLIGYGMDVTLHIVGMEIPEKYNDLPFVQGHGYLNKKDSEQYQQYISLLLDADIFLFPSKAECSAIVFCEASGFGLPIFAYDTGGVGNYVVNGINGYRLPIDSTGEDFARCIQNAVVKEELDMLSKGASDLYKKRLNWTVWSEKVSELLKAI